jgi:hypothetical protein
MVSYLAGHAFHQLADILRELAVSLSVGAIRLLCQQRQRSLEAVRKIACGCGSALHGFLPFFEQRVQIVDEGLHFAWVHSLHSPVLAHTNGH